MKPKKRTFPFCKRCGKQPRSDKGKAALIKYAPFCGEQCKTMEGYAIKYYDEYAVR